MNTSYICKPSSGCFSELNEWVRKRAISVFLLCLDKHLNTEWFSMTMCRTQWKTYATMAPSPGVIFKFLTYPYSFRLSICVWLCVCECFSEASALMHSRPHQHNDKSFRSQNTKPWIWAWIHTYINGFRFWPLFMPFLSIWNFDDSDAEYGYATSLAILNKVCKVKVISTASN